ncbi:MAG: IS1182 family transposase [Burkholderiales bacterium]
MPTPHAKSYRPWNPYQSYLLPPSPLEWLPEDHLAYFLVEVVQSLDLSAIERVMQSKDPRGERPYAPRMMVALLLYGYCVGLFSSRKIARATYSDVAFRVIAGENHPHFTTVNQFRLDHHEALAGTFVQVLRLCQKAGLVKLGHVSLDGTKMQANASKHKAMSYQRMQEQEVRLKAEVEAMLTRADAIDRAEDERYGIGQEASDLPAELRRREARREKIQQAKAALEEEAARARAEELRAQAQALRKKAADESVDPAERKRAATRATQSEEKAQKLDPHDEDDPPSASGTAADLPHHRVPTTPEGTPAPTAQRNFTDPESRIMKNNNGYLQGYNAHIAVDAESQVIVADAVTNQAPDPEHLAPMLDRILDNCGRAPDVATADSGFFSAANVDACERRGIDAFIAVSRKNETDPAATNLAEPTSAQQAKQRMRDKLQTETGKSTYARRKAIVEPAFGQIKEARGFRRFLLRGIAKVRAEWRLVCTTHNLLKLFRARRSAKSTGCQPLVAAPA